MISIYINIKDKIAPLKINLYKDHNSFSNLKYLISDIDCCYYLKIAYNESQGNYIFLEIEKNSQISNTDNELLYQVMYELTQGKNILFKKELSAVI